MRIPFKPRTVYWAPEDGGPGGFLQNAMSMFHRSPAAKPNAVIDPKTFKFDPTTGKPINGTEDPNNPDPNKSPANPLEMFGKMWETPNSSEVDTPPSFKLDPEKLKTLAGSLDFTQHVTPELQEKLKSGDPQAMREALNGLGQSAYMKLMEHMPALTEAYVSAKSKHDQKGLGRSVKSTLTKQGLDKLAAGNPLLKKQLDTIGEQLLGQFPDASPEWLAEQTPKYFVEIAKLLSPGEFKEVADPAKPQPQPGESDYDWASYLAGKPQPTTNK